MAEEALRVLLPRPWREHDQFLELLASLELPGRKLEVLRWPVMAIVPRKIDDASDILDRLRCADIVIFVSAPAANAALQIAGCRGAIGERLVIAVGRTTADELAALGVDAQIPGSANTEGLLAMSALQQVSGKHIVICRGIGGREALAETLRARGALVDYLELYERVGLAEYAEAINRALVEDPFDLIVIHSGQILHHLLEVVEEKYREKLSGIPVLIPGPRVAEICTNHGLCCQIVAEDALPVNMAAALVRWYTRG